MTVVLMVVFMLVAPAVAFKVLVKALMYVGDAWSSYDEPVKEGVR